MQRRLLRLGMLAFAALAIAGSVMALLSSKITNKTQMALQEQAVIVQADILTEMNNSSLGLMQVAQISSNSFSPEATQQSFVSAAAQVIRQEPHIYALMLARSTPNPQATRFADGALETESGKYQIDALVMNREAAALSIFSTGRLGIEALQTPALKLAAETISPPNQMGELGVMALEPSRKENNFWVMQPEQPESLLIWMAIPVGIQGDLVFAAVNPQKTFTIPIDNSEYDIRFSPVSNLRVIQAEVAENQRQFLVPVGIRGLNVVLSAPKVGLFGIGIFPLLLALLCSAIGTFILHLLTQNIAFPTMLNAQSAAKQNSGTMHSNSDNAQTDQRFRMLAESTGAVPWAANIKERRFLYIGPQIEAMTGYPVQTWFARGFWVDHVHPSDRQDFLINGLRGVVPGKNVIREYRTRTADGKVLHLRNTFTVLPPEDPNVEPTEAQGFMLDITEIKKVESEQKRLMSEAEAANKTKSDFLANMSHELRTPLNVVIGFSEVMKDELFGPLGARYRDYAVSIHQSGKHLLDLINDVLDLSRIEAGKVELLEEETDINALLADCRTLLHERASTVGLHIRLEIPAPIPTVMADGRRLKQVILNLMSNAIKFTQPGGRVTLRAQVQQSKGLAVSVMDTGIGMSQAEIEVAMQQFGQIDNELSRQHDGTGLGLPIAKSLAEMHGGSLVIESKKNIGTKVTLWLPLERLLVQDIG